MASNGGIRRKLLTAGGVLSIVAGIAQVICSGLMIVPFVPNLYCLYNGKLLNALFLPGLPETLRVDIRWYINWGTGPIGLPMDLTIQRMIIVVCLGVLGILAVVGGVSAIRRKRFGLSLAGAICALPSVFVGILAIIFIALGKIEFRSVRG